MSLLNDKKGILYIVATPIGNLSDISLRALEILQQVDLIAAEDTRHSKKLLNQYSITTKLVSLHNFNEKAASNILLQNLLAGKNIALISDAGTPLISDPGFVLVAKVREASIRVVPIPGACAAITALCASGLSTEKFIFAGFSPIKKSQLQTYLEKFLYEDKTVIFYEAPHRILQFIDILIAVCGINRKIVLAKELTKTFETIVNGSVLEIKSWLLENADHQKGEFVILLAGIDKKVDKNIAISDETKRIYNILKAKMSHSDAVKLTAEITCENKKQIYQIGI